MRYNDLEVYKKLIILNNKVYNITLNFPKFEKYELGSQLRRSANSIPANLAESFGNKQVNIYLQGISIGMGELRETRHHLFTAFQRNYIEEIEYNDLLFKYEECSKMLYGLEMAIKKSI